MQSLIFKCNSTLISWAIALLTSMVYAQNKPSEKWEGTLKVNEDTKLRIAFESSENQKGKFHSIDQKAFNIEMDNFKKERDSLSFQLISLNAEFKGRIANDGLKGHLLIGGQPFEAHFLRCDSFGFSIAKRPQEEQIGGNYTTEEFTCISSNKGNILSGTLSIPNNQKNFPTVVFISGSGPNDRDHTIFGHKNFLVVADLLAKEGIASLRLDDRGVGKSEGDFETASIYDLANDISDAVNLLAVDPRINPNKIGIIGHSLGAEIAPRVSVINQKVKYIIMMAGSADPLYKCIIDQTETIYAAQVKSQNTIDLNTKILNAIFESLKETKDDKLAIENLNQKLNLLRDDIKKIPENDLKIIEIEPTVTANDFKHFFNNKWRTDLFYEPTQWLKKINVPVLAINGSLDTQVLPKNLELIKKTLENQKHKNFEIKLYEGKNHMLQNAKTGLPSEYAEIEETIATEVVVDIINWINQITK